MRVEIEQDARLKSPEITIRCPAIDEDILRIVAMLRVQEQKITGILDGDYHLLDAKAILYFESVDKRTFCYTSEAVYSNIIKAMEESLKKAGYQLVLSYSNGDYREERKNLELYMGMQAMGVVFMPISAKNKNLVSLLTKRGIAVLQLFNRVYDNVDTISVMDDRGVYHAMQHLINYGHRRVLLLNVPTPYSTDRADGYRKAMLENGLAVDESLIVTIIDEPSLSDRIQELIDMLKPTAIIAGVYSLGKNVIRACRKKNLQIPKDISIITVDDVEWPELLDITAVAQPVEYVGVSAVRILMDRINGNIDSKQPVVTSVEPEMQFRKSVHNIRKSNR